MFVIIKRILPSIILLMVTLLIFTAFPVETISAAKTIDTSDSAVKKLEDKLAKLDSDKKELQNKINKAAKDIENVKTYKEYLDSQLRLTTDDIETTNQLIIEYQNQIRNTADEIAALETESDKNYEIFKQRMRMSYEEGNIGHLEIILGSESLSEFIMRVERVANLLDYEQELMERLENEASELSVLKAAQEEKRKKTEDLVKSLVDKEALLEKQSKESAQYINELKYSQTYAEQMLEQNNAARNQIDKEIEEILLERQRQKNAAYVGGDLRWPVDDKWKRISSGYGYRDFDRSIHRGIDIPADYGSNVYAANGGTVVSATYHSSYGYYVLIDHGGDLATLYAHNSSLSVAAGDTVSIGDTIAKIGNTGNSYGNHLHFEVRVKGAAVDPLKKPHVVVPGK